jgi:hypothetical protein
MGMATASKAIARIAEVAGVLPSAASRAARYLRETDTNLWPEGSAGRGQEAHVEPRHLVNLVLALAAADPITTAPETVATLRNSPAQLWEVKGMEKIVPGNTLGEALDGIIESGGPSAMSLHGLTLTITRWSGRLSVEMQDHEQTGPDIGDTKLRGRTVYQNFSQPQREPEAGAISYRMNIPAALLDTLAELYADTVKHRAQRAKRFSQT